LIVPIAYAHHLGKREAFVRSDELKPSVLSSRANGAADGAPKRRRRALRLRPLAVTEQQKTCS